MATSQYYLKDKKIEKNAEEEFRGKIPPKNVASIGDNSCFY